MKKTYSIPEMETVQIETQQMLAASIGLEGVFDPTTDPIDARELDEYFVED